MKKACYFLLLLFISPNAKAENAYPLSEAIQKKLVSVKVHGAKPDTSFHGDFSSHYGPCMSMEILSSTASSLSLHMDYGYKLVPQDSSLQTMMVTQTLLVKLLPKQKKNLRLYAMCTEASDGAPSPEAEFRMGRRAAGNLLVLAELVNRKKYQGEAAQNAVWCLTNNHDLQSIFCSDTGMMYELRRFVARAKGTPVSAVYAGLNESQVRSTRTFTTRTVYSGSLSYSIIGSSKVMIALFDEDNHMKKVYVNNETQREGEYAYKYQISSEEMDEKRHYLRMFRNGKLEEEISIIPHHP